MLMAINPGVFKAYDIRGVYPSEINEEVAPAAAKAFAFFLNAGKLVIGRDARASSPSIYKAIVKSLTASGVNVIDIGVCPTPLLSYTVSKKGFPGGIMISASHNPPEYNALKLIKAPCLQISSPGDMDEVKKLALNPRINDLDKKKNASVEALEVKEEYIKEVCEEFTGLKGMTVAVDYGNGMGSITAKPVMERLGVKVIPLYEEIDGTFPNHPANPAEEKNLDELIKKVVMQKADMGIAFDGDADRSFIVDDTGRIIWPDQIAALLIPSELKGRSDKRVYYDLRFSRIVDDVLRKNKGKGSMMRVGNPFYKEKLLKQGGVFAVELSGHFMFQDHYCIDDGLYAALKVMQVVRDSKKKLSELAKPLMKYFTSPEINIKVADPDATLEKVRIAFRDGKSINIDGVYISYPDWWFSLRKSNTEPVVRLRLEADSKEKLEEMKQKIVGLIK
jgi:phosphomannomutase